MRVVSSTLLILSAVQACLSFGHRRHHSPKSCRGSKKSHPTVAQSWFTGWNAADFPPELVSWEKYNVVSFAFVVTTPKPCELAVASEDEATLRKLVEYGHGNKTAVTISIGGWTGSRYFSSSLATKHNRTEFIRSINKIVKEYDLDGVDIDWEYPNVQGLGCNTISPNDTANLLEFLKELRSSELKKDAIVTAATSIRPFADANGNPSKNVAEFAKYLSWIEIMNYDIWSPSTPTTGPVGPLNDSCVSDPSTEATGSAVSAVKSWSKAGFPKNKIVLGVPSYGYGYAVNQTSAFKKGSKRHLAGSFVPFDKDKAPFGDSWQGPPSVDACGVNETVSSLYDFWSLSEMGLIGCDGLPEEGVLNYFDECSKSPSIYDSKTGIWYEYDDPRTYKAKGEFILEEGLKGFAMWETAGDWNDLLLDAIREGGDFPKVNYDPHRTAYPTQSVN